MNAVFMSALEALECNPSISVDERVERRISVRAPVPFGVTARFASYPVEASSTRLDDPPGWPQVAMFLGGAGLYTEAQATLAASWLDAACIDRPAARADRLHALAWVRWRSQQARQGGDEDFLWSIVAAALESAELRRAGAGAGDSSVDQRKLAQTLEVLAENAACYGASPPRSRALPAAAPLGPNAEKRGITEQISKIERRTASN